MLRWTYRIVYNCGRLQCVRALGLLCQYLPLAIYCNQNKYGLRITTIATFLEPGLDSRYGFFKLLNRTQDNNTFEAGNIIQIIWKLFLRKGYY
jgi:hypothetical protein